MKIKKLLCSLLAVVMLFATLTACGNGGDGGAGGKHLNFACYNYSDSLDPITNVNSSWCGTRYGITECLFRFSDDVTAEPNICESYKVSDDYTTWTLKIRDGVKFSNGNDVTPSAVVSSIERLYKETDASQGGTGGSDPKAYLTYKSIEADDANGTVTIICEKATSNLPGILSYPYFSIIDTSVVDTEIIGTGPYKVDKINTGVSIDLSRNEHYWNGEVPYDTMTIMFIDDSSTKAMALQSGDVDLTENITTASDLEKLSNDEAYYVSTAAGVRTGNSYMNFNGVLGNETLRQAILMALDNETMCNTTVAGMYTAGISVLPSSLSYGYENLTNPYPYNTEKAKELLDSAGIVDTNGDGFRELDGETIDLDYIAYSSRNLNEFAEAIAIQLNDIGIKTTVRVIDYDSANQLKNVGEFDLITSNAITVGDGDPQGFLSNWYSGNSEYYGYYSNPEYDSLFEELMVTYDTGRRAEIIEALQQILIDDAATIVHGYYNSRMISNASKVTGAEIATIDYYWITTDIKPAA